MKKNELEAWRNEIDAIDRELVALLEKRLDVAGEIGKIKKREQLPVLDIKREHLVLESRQAMVKNAAYKPLIKEVFESLMIQSKKRQ